MRTNPIIPAQITPEAHLAGQPSPSHLAARGGRTQLGYGRRMRLGGLDRWH
jgi:hypothetical protein